MKFFSLPETTKDYPKYMLVYWITIWMIFFLISTISILPKISENGYVFRQDVCLEYGTTGRFDEFEKCIDYGEPIYKPVGKTLLDNFKTYGINSGIFVLIIGLFLRHGQKIQEQKTKSSHSVNKILTDEQIIRFLKYIKNYNLLSTIDDSEYDIYKKIDQNIPLKEILEKKDEDGYGYILEISKSKGFGNYLVTFGYGGPGGGSGCSYKLFIDDDNIIKIADDVEMTHWDNC